MARDSNPGPVFSIPGFVIEEFLIPESHSVWYQSKKTQQGWQTSALARLVSMSVIFCLLPNSSIVILLFSISVIFYISEQHVWKLWVWIAYSSLVWRFLFGEHQWLNNPITLISWVPWVGSIFCRWQSMRSSANFRTPTHWMPSSDQIFADNV